ncbi:MAG: hypothetical protein ACLTR6_03310 [Clostridium fessum]
MRPSSLTLQLLKLFPEKRLEQPEEEKERALVAGAWHELGASGTAG